MGFLNKHCQIAWEMAVHNCNLIFSGLTDIIQRKLFVSSFENAIEICFKQILLDANDHQVIKRLKINNQSLWNRYSSSTDLNSFFQGVYSSNSSLMDEFFSEQISNIKTVCTNGISNQSGVLNRIELLIKLRNNETHFFIDESNYLSIQEFKELCLLMKEMQGWFITKNIIEHEPSGAPNVTSSKYLGYFDKDISMLTTYEALIKNGDENKMILLQIPEYQKWDYENDLPNGWWYYVEDENDNYSICHSIYQSHGINDPDGICMDFLMNLNEFYRRFILMRDQNLIIIEKNIPTECKVKKPFIIISRV